MTGTVCEDQYLFFNISRPYLIRMRNVTNKISWCVTNQTLHTDLQIPYVRTVIHDRINKHRIALASHPNPLVEPVLHPEHNRRLKRRLTFDLID